jgi:cytochrome c556
MRAPIELSGKEQEHLRFEMRKLLESVQMITEALAEDKMDFVAENAKKYGMGIVDDAAISLAMKTTPEFVALSADMHQKFDDLALYATQGGTKTGALKQLGAILANCTACHAAYRISPQ